MKIIQTFEQNQLASADIQKKGKNTVFFYDKDKKVTLVSLGFFDKLNLFFQKIFCCRSASKLKLKNFTKISNPELKTILQSTPQQPPVQVTKEEPNQQISNPIRILDEPKPPKEVNVVYTLKEGFSGSDYEIIKRNIDEIAKSLKECDQEDLNKSLYSFIRALTSYLPIGRLARGFFEAQQFDKLYMFIIALEEYNKEIMRLFGQDDSRIINIINQYKGKFDETEAALSVNVVTPKKILQEAKSFDQARVTQLAKEIRSVIENEGLYQSSDLDFWMSQYVIEVLDVEPLITLTKHFVENNENQKAERMFHALKNASNKKHFGELKIEKMKAFLKESGKIEEPTFETAQKYFKEKNFDEAIKALEALDEKSEPVQKLYGEICKELIITNEGTKAGKVFNKILNITLICDLMQILAKEYKTFQTVLEFTHQLDKIKHIIDIYILIVKYGDLEASKAWELVLSIDKKGKDLGEPSKRLNEYIKSGNVVVQEAMEALRPAKI